MELGAEISQKIRSAIKAKLVDLGAYVDDELPDYIMVMVANKKNVSQMTADLNLFLGNNTEKFTTWLGGLLNKLQTITADSEKNEKHIEEAQSEVIIASTSGVPPPQSPGDDSIEPEIKLEADLDARFEEEGIIEIKKEPSVEADASRRRESSDKSPEESPTLSRTTSDRKRKLVSVSGAMVTHDFETDDEEYDPLNPAVGKVASIVRVSERKSSVPLGRQANKSLLMRAMQEAETSVERVKIVRPMRRESPEPPRIRSRLGVRRERSGDRTQSSRDSRLNRRRRSSERTITRTVSSQSSRHSREGIGVAGRSLQLFSRSKRNEVRRQIRGYRSRSESEGEEGIEEIRHVHCTPTATGSTAAMKPPIYTPSQIVSPLSPTQSVDDELEEHFELDTLVEPGADESDFVDDERDVELSDKHSKGISSRIIHESMHGIELAQRPPSPKFVVTLDGVDPESLKAAVEEEEDGQMKAKEVSNVLKVQPIRPIKPFTINLTDDDGVDEGVSFENDGEAAAKKAKLTEKCLFWPGCKKGAECPYVHPTTPCTNFPHCRFGNSCMYVHPVCKFDAMCTRPDCIYGHTSKRTPPPPVPLVMQPIKVPMFSAPSGPPPRPKAPAEITCRFFPNCTNLNCVFNHPKPCRFGISCSRKGTCTFTHPSLPGKDKLRWVPCHKPDREKDVTSPVSPLSASEPSLSPIAT